MAVVAKTLEVSIKAILDSNPNDVNMTAKQLANAYNTYCQTAAFGVSKPSIPSVNKTALEKTILSGIKAQNIDVFCLNIQNGITTYWTSVPVAGASGAGVTTPPAGNIVSALKTALTVPYPGSTTDSAKAIATQMDILSKTVKASLTIPSTPPVTAIYPLA